ncbi:hypothetical protein GQ55_9G013300 [Panicum hallii var. hallii]|uniref:RRM domain-containing protein n=1 Tax=Panicum hallii var. hallii TaxID=1504633 RepID=A0A2T7BYG3_9POAL|nr:hypothetical protein GQ55_9G013300 [Panicum hallii var. hallii]
MDTFDLPNAIKSCIMHGRQLYYRLVFLLGMDPSLSIEIVAFWLLVEGNGEVDFLRHINSFHGDHFLALVGMGKQFIDAMHGNPVGLKSRSARELHRQVMLGMCFFLNNVCYKVLNDLRQKAEQGVTIHDMEESLKSSYHVLREHMKDRPHISLSYNQYQGESSISRSMPSAIECLVDMEESSDSNYHVLYQYMKDQPHISMSYHRYQEDCSISRSMLGAIKSLKDIEESLDSNYHVLHQYMKNQPHISTSYHQYQEDCSISRRSMPRAINCFEDMVKARDEVQSNLGNMISQQQKNTGWSISSRSTIVPTVIQNHQDMVKLRYGAQSMNAFSMDLDIISRQQQKSIGVNVSSRSDIHDLESLFNKCMISSQFPSEWGNTFPQSSTTNMNPYVHSPIPQHDRTLFVTFSNGYPLTKKEVYKFFMSNFGDVESLSIEEPIEVRPPQYALVTFGFLETVLLILDGKEKVKFVTGGKHLWARKYVPKKQQKGKNKAWM